MFVNNYYIVYEYYISLKWFNLSGPTYYSINKQYHISIYREYHVNGRLVTDHELITYSIKQLYR